MKYLLFSFTLLLFISCQNTDNSRKKVPTTESPRPNILFLLADDWSYPHASIYGANGINTPVFDRLATEGALFHHAYCAAPSCSPSRASILTSRYPHQLGSAGNLWSVIPDKYPNWMGTLERAQYFTGHTRKGWGPGDFRAGGYTENPAGRNFENFREFMSEKPKDQPFAFWFGSHDPHRDYETNSGQRNGGNLAEVTVPGFLPDVSCVRNDLLDYYFEVERFDRECGLILDCLDSLGLLDNTMVIMTSDNGMPFPRAKANLYDYGTRMPLAVYWKRRIESGTVINDFTNFVDFGPTILSATGAKIPKAFHGKSLLPLLTGQSSGVVDRQQVFLERERHANVRKGNLSYPSRAIRTHEYLYIRNYESDRWPAGDPEVHQSVGQFGDVDNSISKFLILANEGETTPIDYFKLAFGKRPNEELYDVQKDPYQLNNLAEIPEYFPTKTRLNGALRSWMNHTGDRRAFEPNTVFWDTVRYTPDYQHESFNLEKKLAEYRMLSTAGENIKCR